MTLKPTDMLEIQSAIDEYERKFPRRPAPSAKGALVWRVGKREAARVLARTGNPEQDLDVQECSRFMWALERLKFRLDRWTPANDESSESAESMTPWVRGVIVAGGCSVGAVVAVSLFFFGALVGGFK